MRCLMESYLQSGGLWGAIQMTGAVENGRICMIFISAEKN
jgi:hypothetical protein